MFATDEIHAPAGVDMAFDGVAASILGGGLPAGAEMHLKEAGASYHQDDIAETHLLAALDLAPDHPAALISLYRFYFYKGRLPEALNVARMCLATAARELRLAGGWRDARPGDADFGSYSAILPRFFMFSLKGYAYLQMRTGAIDEGRAAVGQLLALDPSDKINAGLLVSVADRLGADDDD